MRTRQPAFSASRSRLHKHVRTASDETDFPLKLFVKRFSTCDANFEKAAKFALATRSAKGAIDFSDRWVVEGSRPYGARTIASLTDSLRSRYCIRTLPPIRDEGSVSFEGRA